MARVTPSFGASLYLKKISCIEFGRPDCCLTGVLCFSYIFENMLCYVIYFSPVFNWSQYIVACLRSIARMYAYCCICFLSVEFHLCVVVRKRGYGCKKPRRN